ncbi:unconventional myosin-Va isoform X2 [Daktulosphaira vitifoliae]|uniref:unconventional myosin-Va isoform X2 n=1 Tax=Daktulosphaira vitifoliae TaxID=58002 RepID=UPI0021AA2EED|nr:unconventional myosin-Va isoform X2 [Daktulosphaira vitifoliae]XP_050522190.1 unconventional myosin-Va isoform X2 [Daktulosphaira vitifoliae]XP_050522191.1 unconventional myosin-Va isoform X2 [Daktulosphaira vitifoliae]
MAEDIKKLYVVGTKIWVPCKSEVWQAAEIIESYDGQKLVIRKTKDGIEQVLKVNSEEELPPLQNPDILIGENDLTSLSYLHEPAILYNLYCRFVQSRAIYTYCGIVLVAINPYQDLDIYGIDTMMTYRGQTMGSLDPHVFAVAEQAFNKMEIENNNQSIIVSGESGAGKTVSAKYAMRYFATISGSETETQVEKKVLASSPIMEAIGNAKTTRNDNSSRFGKYIELHFDDRNHIIGASMRTYLLEKSRVVYQASEERNYHIFYQLCSARHLFPHLKLGSSEEYLYLSCQSCSKLDEENFNETIQALNTLGFSQEDQDLMWRVLASILHLGNVQITDRSQRSAGDGDSCFILQDEPSLHIFSSLLDVDSGELLKWLCYRKIVSMRETYEKPMTVEEAIGARDALAKHMYASLFQWLISIMNKTMCETSPTGSCPIIGVLDIYGFEMFELNSFEQFCINYANEKLQQQFNLHVFKLEQEEYGKEGIEWKFIDFYDNQPCIDLIESKLGILDLLDEECRMPQGSDASWTQKLYTKCTKWDRFSKPKFAGSAFTIKHFAGDVEYYSNGFLDKNKDTVIEDQVNVLRNGKNSLLRSMFMIDNSNEHRLSIPDRRSGVLSTPKSATIGPTPKSRMLTPMRPICATIGSPSQTKQNKKTVGSQFRDSLNALMTTLNDTTPHYIRCVKPNDLKLPFVFDHQRAVDQLRACGVLETIRISAAGFPSRWSYIDFFSRYRILLKSNKINRNDPKLTCQRIVEEQIQSEDNYKYGNTKIFFRAGQVAYLERKRGDKRKDCSITIQKTWRSYICQKKYKQIQRSVLLIQRYGRGLLGRRLTENLRQNQAAIKIQKEIRRWLCQKKYLRAQRATLTIQCYYRGYVARKFTQNLRENIAAVQIQSVVRMWLCYRHYHNTLDKIIKVQCCIRRWFARKCLKALKKEARSVAHVTKLNKGLENKIYMMQQKIIELNNQISTTKLLENELQEAKQKLSDQKSISLELIALKKKVQHDETKFNTLTMKYESEKKITEEKLEFYKEKLKTDENSLMEAQKIISDLKLTLLQAKQDNEKKINEIHENWKMKYDDEILKARQETEAEKSKYQKLLSEKRLVEERLEILECHSNSTSVELKYNGSDLSILPSIQENGYMKGDSNDVNVQNIYGNDDINKLQKTLKATQMERDLLKKKIENDKLLSDTSDINDVSQLKEQNYILRQNLNTLREVTNSTGNNNFLVADDLTRQLEALQDELFNKRAECQELQNRLDGTTESLRKIVDYERTSSSLSEDKELNQAIDAQKAINRHLVEELQSEKIKWKEEKEKMSLQLSNLLRENEKQQELLAIEYDKNPQSDAVLQSDVTKLNYDNTQLKQNYDELLRKYVLLRNDLLLGAKENSTINFDITLGSENFANSTTISTEDSTIIAKKKNRTEYMGMFQCSIDDDPIVARNLIIELRPETALKLLPGLPAYILFMCTRYHDFQKDEKRIASFLTTVVKNLQKVMKKRQHQDSKILWLSNTLRLVHILKQYSGEPAFASDNTSKQNSQVLQNFDLADYRQVFCDHAVLLYQELIHKMQETIRPMIVPAVLEHDSLGIDSVRNVKRSFGSLKSNSLQSPPSPTTNTLENELNSMYSQLMAHEIDIEVIVQIFKQLYYYICANALNNLLLRKDLSYWAKGMSIRFNLSHLEQWIRDKISHPQEVVNTLLPIIQASQLLQARKTDDDVSSICEMCDKMNANQIVKLLTSFKPTDDCEDRISMDFIRRVKDKLEERPECQDKEKLLMDTKYEYPITFPFHPSNIRLEDIDVPEILNLPMLKKM